MKVKEYDIRLLWDKQWGFKIGWWPRKTLPIFWYMIFGFFELRIFPPEKWVKKIGRETGEIVDKNGIPCARIDDKDKYIIGE